MEKEITIQTSDYRFGGRRYIFTGQKIKVLDLFNLSLVASSNEAIAALVRSTGLDEASFVIQMNKKAKTLGLTSSDFVEPTGLDPKNISSARDISKLLGIALEHSEIVNATAKDSLSFRVDHGGRPRNVSVVATDKLLNSFLKVRGGKTGFLEEAGYCLTSSLIGEQGQTVIVTVLGSPTSNQRFQDVKALGWWVFKNWTWPEQIVLP